MTRLEKAICMTKDSGDCLITPEEIIEFHCPSDFGIDIGGDCPGAMKCRKCWNHELT